MSHPKQRTSAWFLDLSWMVMVAIACTSGCTGERQSVSLASNFPEIGGSLPTRQQTTNLIVAQVLRHYSIDLSETLRIEEPPGVLRGFSFFTKLSDTPVEVKVWFRGDKPLLSEDNVGFRRTVVRTQQVATISMDRISLSMFEDNLRQMRTFLPDFKGMVELPPPIAGPETVGEVLHAQGIEYSAVRLMCDPPDTLWRVALPGHKTKPRSELVLELEPNPSLFSLRREWPRSLVITQLVSKYYLNTIDPLRDPRKDRKADRY